MKLIVINRFILTTFIFNMIYMCRKRPIYLCFLRYVDLLLLKNKQGSETSYIPAYLIDDNRIEKTSMYIVQSIRLRAG